MDGKTGSRYRQLAEAMRTRILSGELSPGARLPTVRASAREHGLSPQTVLAAYELLRNWGLISAQVGNGTFVARRLLADAARDRLSQLPESGPFAEFEPVSEGGGLRSLASAVPDPHFFRSDDLMAELREVAADPWAFYYAPAQGAPELRDALATRMRSAAIAADDESVFVTLGAGHAIGLLLDMLCDRGDVVIVQAPGFLGAPSFFESRDLRVVWVDASPDGIDPDQFRKAAHEGARVALVWPDFGPATGTRWSEPARGAFLRQAEKLDVRVIEDGHFAPLDFKLPLAPISAASKDVLYVDALSAYLSPGVRIGWIRCSSPELRRSMAMRLSQADGSGVLFLQRAVAGFLRRGLLDDHLDRVIPRYRERCDAMMASLRRHMPKGVSWSDAGGGLSLWVRTPDDLVVRDLYTAALRQGVSFAPGELFNTMPDCEHRVRLCFGAQPPGAIDGAISTLARLLSYPR